MPNFNVPGLGVVATSQPSSFAATTVTTLQTSGDIFTGANPAGYFTTTGQTKVHVGGNGSLMGGTPIGAASGMSVLQNAELNAAASAYAYISTDTASRYFQLSGVHNWSTAVSGAAGSAITWVQQMSLSASGLTVNNGLTVSAGGITVQAGTTSVQALTATQIRSFISDTTFPNNTIVNLATLTVKGTYLFGVANDGGGVAANGGAICTVDGAGNVAILAQWVGASGVFAISGGTIQYKQTTGVSQNMTVTFTLLA